jgi:uncharacterized membrane protein YuzA (DUF378 family)
MKPPSNMVRLYTLKIAKILVVIGALVWGSISLFNYNFVEKLLPINPKLIYGLVGLAGLYLVLDRNYYLSFLGETVYPCGSLVEKIPEKADQTVSVKVPPGSNVVYWAAEPSNENVVIDNPWDAYMQYENAGVVKADENGNAVLKFRSPASYKVMAGLKQLPKHVHYRHCFYPGMLSEIYSIEL